MVPIGAATAVAAAVGLPALYAVRAAPGAVLGDLHLMRRGMFLQKLAVVGEPGDAATLHMIQRRGQRHIAMRMMMAVGLAVGGDVH